MCSNNSELELLRGHAQQLESMIQSICRELHIDHTGINAVDEWRITEGIKKLQNRADNPPANSAIRYQSYINRLRG